MKNSILSIAAMALLSGNAIAQQKPNIILFLVDDMGWQDTSLPFWNDTTELNHIYETPNMERLAKKGVRFTHAYACPISSPSRVSLFTGANAARHKVTNWTLKKDTPTDRKNEMLDFEAWNYNGLCPEPGLEHSFYAKCLPQLLRENGYTTMMVGKAHFGSIDTPAANPLAIGFDYNMAGHAAGAMGSYLGEEGYGASGKPEWAAIWAVPDLEKYHGTDTFLTEALTLEAKGLMDKALDQSKPFFLYMSHYAVHAPFGTDKRFYQKYMDKGLPHKEAQYAALVEGMDKSLGDLMDYVDRKGIADHTVIIFMSDNGGYTIGRADKNAPLSEGKGSLKEGGIREPMIVYYPNVTFPSTMNDTPVIIEDFFPTLLEIAGVHDYQTPQQIDGQSFMAQVKGQAGEKERALFFHYPNNWGERIQTIGAPQSAVVKGDWKLIHYYETGSSCLYNLNDDISEQHDLSACYPDKVKELAKVLSDYLRAQHATMPILKTTGKFVPYPDGEDVERVLPKDDETLVYDNPGDALHLKKGDMHPKMKGWSFYTAHEFNDKDTKKGLPLGFVEHRGLHMSRTAKVDNRKCSKVEDGVLRIWSVEEKDSIDNRFGKKVKYSHGCYRTSLPGSKEFWCNFTENMRIEIRFKRTPYVGFNDALWFMGNNNRPWPKNGEIDLLENPKKTLNDCAHFTLHSENHYAGVIGGGGSVTSSINLANMSQWNIYWLEWYPDRIVGGVNGQVYFEHHKGADGNTDWPWSDPLGFFLIFSTGISTNPNAWPGAIIPSEWKKDAKPAMYIDWIRVYTNRDYKGENPPAPKYY